MREKCVHHGIEEICVIGTPILFAVAQMVSFRLALPPGGGASGDKMAL